MRLFCAAFGVLTIPIAYLTIRAAGFSKLAGLMAAIIVCFGRIEVSLPGPKKPCPHF
jgi:dolichyl-phosphate-mannose--protein O-mannosyl transferase